MTGTTSTSTGTGTGNLAAASGTFAIGGDL